MVMTYGMTVAMPVDVGFVGSLASDFMHHRIIACKSRMHIIAAGPLLGLNVLS